MTKRRIKTPELAYCDFIKVYWDSDLREYSVTARGNPDATYFTDDRTDALATAQRMRNEFLAHCDD